MRRAMEYDVASEEGGSAHSGRVGFSGPLSGPLGPSSLSTSSSTTTTTTRKNNRKSTRFSGDLVSKSDHDHRYQDEEEYVEITLDLRDDTVSIQDIKGADQEAALLASQLMERQSGAPRSSRLTSQLSAKLRHVSHELRRVASISRRDLSKFDRTKSTAARALRGLQFINKSRVGDQGWAEVERRFEQLAVDGLLPRSRFGQCIGMSEKEFAGELYDALARKRGIVMGMINKAELKDFWEQLSDQSFDARIQTFFDMVDKNADGRITEEEVREIISLSASANKLSKIQEHADEYAALIMEELDPDGLGYIEIHNLEMLLVQGGGVSGGPMSSSLITDSRKLSQMLSQKLVPTREPNPIKRGWRRLSYFMEDNWKRVWVILVWLSVCAALFTWKFLQYKNRYVYHVMGACVSTAKGGAETLKFNMALILLPVSRNLITFLRNHFTSINKVVPFDDNINFHKVIAAGIVVGIGLHAGAHLTCDFPRLLHSTDAEYEPLADDFGAHRPGNYWWFVKGTEGWSGIAMVVLMAIAFTLAQPWFRRNRVTLPTYLKRLTGFNAFWYSHHLFVIVYALLILHGNQLYLTHQWYKKTTWMYLALPMGIYALERLIRAFRSTSYKTSVQIIKVAVYPGNVLALYMSKPQGFKYTSGQYIFLNCSDVSPFQWHPFSLTSAPGDDYISVHIRTLGDWTSQLKSIFSKVCQPDHHHHHHILQLEKQQQQQQHDIHHQQPKMPKLLIDGPYGAPAQDYKKYDVLLLVGLGIGATPLISIVKDVINNIIIHNNNNTFPPVQRAYFYWVTREQGSFEWFRGVMNDVAEHDTQGVIDLHNYCTSVYEEGDARSALIAMLQTLHHAKNGIDIVSGTRVKTHFARPNWRNVFKRVALNHPNKTVGVFYCGAPALVGELRNHAQDFSRKTSTRFDFHKENF